MPVQAFRITFTEGDERNHNEPASMRKIVNADSSLMNISCSRSPLVSSSIVTLDSSPPQEPSDGIPQLAFDRVSHSVFHHQELLLTSSSHTTTTAGRRF